MCTTVLIAMSTDQVRRFACKHQCKGALLQTSARGIAAFFQILKLHPHDSPSMFLLRALPRC